MRKTLWARLWLVAVTLLAFGPMIAFARLAVGDWPGAAAFLAERIGYFFQEAYLPYALAGLALLAVGGAVWLRRPGFRSLSLTLGIVLILWALQYAWLLDKVSPFFVLF